MSKEEPQIKNNEKKISFLTYLQKYRTKIINEDTQLPFGRQKELLNYTIENLAFRSGKGLQLAVAAFAPFCIILFTFSFFWDPYHIIRSCSIAGLIGFGTNWIAIKMLFWPKTARPIFGHGLIPSQRNDLIEKITQEVSEKLINEELIQKKIEQSGILQKLTKSLHDKLRELSRDKEFQYDTKEVLNTYIKKIVNDENFRSQIKNIAVSKLENIMGSVLRKKVFFNVKKIWHTPFADLIDKTITKMSELLISVIDDMDLVFENIPKSIEDHKNSIETVLLKMQMSLIQEISIRKIITEQLNTITADQLEEGFREFSDDKLTFITILGGVLGFLGGLVIIWPLMSMVGLLIVIVSLIILDNLIYWLMRKRQARE